VAIDRGALKTEVPRLRFERVLIKPNRYVRSLFSPASLVLRIPEQLENPGSTDILRFVRLSIAMDSNLEGETPPEILYHYTSQAGLIGILDTRTIWASKIHYLNDSREFALALDIARLELNRRIDSATSHVVRDRLEHLRDTIYTIERVHTCVCCHSEWQLSNARNNWVLSPVGVSFIYQSGSRVEAQSLPRVCGHLLSS
jgi:hypothetical protein